jgi:hypothetical protein
MKVRRVLNIVGALCVLAAAAAAEAQPAATLSGYTSIRFDAVPDAPGASTLPAGAVELRGRVFLDGRVTFGERLAVRAAAWAEGLAGERNGTARRAAVVQPHEITLTWSTRAVELTAGAGQVVWGRLDEFQPTDVVNPIDVTRFFLEGRAEARRAVGLARARVFLPGGATLDGVYVPVFRAATFDMLGDATSPFALAPRQVCVPGGCLPVVTSALRPPVRAGNAQGGAWLSATTGRVDWALMAWRGFEAVPLYVAGGPLVPGARALAVDAVHPRTTVVGGDVETVRGAWGLRGEVAWHRRGHAQAAIASPHSRAFREGGVGVDRGPAIPASATVLGVARRARAGDGIGDRHDLQLVTSVDRSFVRETRRLRVFGVYNPGDRAFVRGVGGVSVRTAGGSRRRPDGSPAAAPIRSRAWPNATSSTCGPASISEPRLRRRPAACRGRAARSPRVCRPRTASAGSSRRRRVSTRARRSPDCSRC